MGEKYVVLGAYQLCAAAMSQGSFVWILGQIGPQSTIFVLEVLTPQVAGVYFLLVNLYLLR